MDQEIKTQNSDPVKPPAKFQLSEDWWSVILAFLLILLAAVGILGKNGIPIKF
jgi:hypothetical protein